MKKVLLSAAAQSKVYFAAFKEKRRKKMRKPKNPKIHEQLAEQADMQIQLDEANKKIADLETSRNNLEKELAVMTVQSNNERHRGDLYRDCYRETLQKYTAERERTWWSRLCN
jgi:hypothetical protein